MAQNVEELQGMLEWAKSNNDQEAIDVFTEDLRRAQGEASKPKTTQSVPEGYKPGALTAEIGDIDSPPLAEKKSTEADIDEQAKYRLDTKKGRAASQKAKERAAQRELNQGLYEEDMKLLADPANVPSKEETYEFMNKHRPAAIPGLPGQAGQAMMPSALFEGNKILRDPKTGELRFAALSAEELEALDGGDKSALDVIKTFPALMAGTVIDQVGNAALRKDTEQENLKSIQSGLWENMPNAERTRFREELARRATAAGEGRQYRAGDIDDMMVTGKLSPQVFKEILDQNPEARDALFKTVAGDESEVSFGERWRRLANKVSAVVPYMPVNVFGAEDTMGDFTGFGQYQGLDEKYERENKQKPLFPGASTELDEWLDTAESNGMTTGQVYNKLLAEPFEKFGGGKQFGEMIYAGADKLRESAMTEELAVSHEKGLVPQDAELSDLLTPEGRQKIFNSPDTAWPWQDLAAFSMKSVEQIPYILESIFPARATGRYFAGQATKDFAGRSLQTMEKWRSRYAKAGGVLGGVAGEGAIIYDQVYSETLKALQEVPFDRLREDPQFRALRASGMTDEDARRMLAQDAARAAGKAGFIWSSVVLGSPMGALYGSSAAGSLLKRNTPLRVGSAFTGEIVQEGAQEGVETKVSDIQIEKIDPENPIFKQSNRYLEATLGGMLFSAGPATMGAVGALSPENPVGYEPEDVNAARKTKAYMDARNERFSLEFMISDPDYIRTTDPIERLHQMHKLEGLQIAESDAIIDMEADVRAHLETRSMGSTAEAELKMLDSLVLSANAMKTDISVARSRRQTAAEMAAEQQVIMQERAKIQQNVTESITKIEDIDRIAGNIEKIQKFEAVDEESMEELVRDGYARTNKDGDQVILPKGKRALKELMRQKTLLEGRIESGYTGAERRNQQELINREIIDNAGPVDRETMLYEDPLTGAKNRRAFNDRVQNIDEKDEDRKTPSQAKAVAAIDVDNLKWVNDNMGEHASGDRLLLAVSDALNNQEGLTLYRVGGDEFVVTGESEEAIEEAMQKAKAELQDKPISTQTDQVIPQITWATGPDYATADKTDNVGYRTRLCDG
jgi:diguanylate cyclase (GGDEF)-like protein